MGNRLSKIVTRTGDQGSTGLANGDRIDKSDARVHAMGDIDELNSQIGVLLTQALPAAVRSTLQREQHTLFNLGGELAIPGSVLVHDEDLARLDAALESFNADLPPLKEFVLPGGNAAASHCHVARAVARRAERQVWAQHQRDPLTPATPRYLNRLSDLLFDNARTLARDGGGSDVTWVRC